MMPVPLSYDTDSSTAGPLVSPTAPSSNIWIIGKLMNYGTIIKPAISISCTTDFDRLSNINQREHICPYQVKINYTTDFYHDPYR